MKPPDDIATIKDADYLHEGPNSGGITGWYLWKGHMFYFVNEGHTGHIDPGVPVATWLARWRADSDVRIQAIVKDLAKRGYR